MSYYIIVNQTSQELTMLSTVTLNCQIFMNSGWWILRFFDKVYKKKDYLELLWKLILRFFGKIYEKKNYLELLWKLWKSQGIEFTFICIYTQHAGSHVLYEKHEGGANLIWGENLQSGKILKIWNSLSIPSRLESHFYPYFSHFSQKTFLAMESLELASNISQALTIEADFFSFSIKFFYVKYYVKYNNRRRFLSNKTQFPLPRANGSRQRFFLEIFSWDFSSDFLPIKVLLKNAIPSAPWSCGSRLSFFFSIIGKHEIYVLPLWLSKSFWHGNNLIINVHLSKCCQRKEINCGEKFPFHLRL